LVHIFFLKVPVPRQEIGRPIMYLFVRVINIWLVYTIFLFHFETVPTVWYIFAFHLYFFHFKTKLFTVFCHLNVLK